MHIFSFQGETVLKVLKETQNIADWGTLSLLLGIDNADVQRIRQNNPGASFNQQTAIIMAWLNKGKASWAALISALRSDLIGRGADANRIARAHPSKFVIC